jgi:hypothetical protein
LAHADLKLTRPEVIETARLDFATTATERRWYETITPEMSDIIEQNADLAFNADEIMAAMGTHREIVVTNESQLLKARVLIENDRKLPHYTYLACFNKYGQGPPPLVIVPSITKDGDVEFQIDEDIADEIDRVGLARKDGEGDDD